MTKTQTSIQSERSPDFLVRARSNSGAPFRLSNAALIRISMAVVDGYSKEDTLKLFASRRGSKYRLRNTVADYSFAYETIQSQFRAPKGNVASYCIFGCTKKRYQWANLTGEYSDLKDYAPMCLPCHRWYDNARRSMDINYSAPISIRWRIVHLKVSVNGR